MADDSSKNEDVNLALLDALKQLREAIRAIPGGLNGVWTRRRGPDLAAGPAAEPAESAPDKGESSDIGRDRSRTAIESIVAGLSSQLSNTADRFRSQMGRATSSISAGFERSFDASIGRVITGIGKGVTGGVSAAQRAYANPGAILGAAGTAWNQASFAAAMMGAFGVKRARHPASQAWGVVRKTATQLGKASRRTGRRAARSIARSLSRRGRRGFNAGAAAWRATGNPMAAMKGFAGGAIPALGGLLNLVSGASAAVQAMRDRAEEINARNRPLSRYNAGVGTAFSQLDMNEYFRNVQQARDVAGSTVTLIRAVDRMRDSWMGVDTFRREVDNRVGGFFAGFSGAIGKGLSNSLAPAVQQMRDADPNGVVASGAGEGFGAGVWATGVSLWDQLLNDPWRFAGFGPNPLWEAYTKGHQVATGTATAHVNAVAGPVWDENRWASDLHRMAAPGPFLKRPTPRK